MIWQQIGNNTARATATMVSQESGAIFVGTAKIDFNFRNIPPA
jgi:hypothetical protein